MAVDRPGPRLSADGRRVYEPDGVTLAAFLWDRSEIAVVRGPWGSGTSSACCQRIWQHGSEQNVGSDGIQRSRWFVMRDSYPKLETTTLETFLYWFPERLYGKLFTGRRPILYEMRVGRIVLDVWFGAYSELGGDSIFTSLEPTGWWWNEIEDIGMGAFFGGHGRVGRMPPVIEGGSKWSGTIADCNAPPADHWLPRMMGESDLPADMTHNERLMFRRPAGMAYFVQPPAVLPQKDHSGRIVGWRLNRGAENLKWLRHVDDPLDEPGKRYYERAWGGQPASWVRKNLANEILPLMDGDPIWPTFNLEVHVPPEPLEPVENRDVWVGLDFGRRPAAVFGQTIDGQHRAIYEAAMRDAGASQFAPEVRGLLARCFPWVMAGRGGLRLWGDPKGEDGTQTDDRTAYDVFAAHGLIVRPAPVKQNNILTRIGAVEHALDQAPGGRQRLVVSKRCARLVMAMAGGYRWSKERPSMVSDRKPVKDSHGYSDISDALQYALLGEGEGREMVGLSALLRGQVVRLPRSSARRFAGARRPF